MKSVETRSLSTELRIVRSEDGSRTVTGLIPYNSPSVDLGGFTEIVAPGAFAQALVGSADVLALRDHDQKLLLGRTKSKTLSLTDSPEGLRYTIKLPNTTSANDLAESIDRGDLDATSFGFIVTEDKWTATGADVLRTLIAVELMEVSPCSFPAYPHSVVSIRSCPPQIRSMIKREDMAEETDSLTSDLIDCGCVKDEDGNCTCAPNDPDEDADDCDGIRNYMHVQLALRQRR